MIEQGGSFSTLSYNLCSLVDSGKGKSIGFNTLVWLLDIEIGCLLTVLGADCTALERV